MATLIKGLNIRQSPNWEKYFESLGWKSTRLKNDASLFIFNTPFGSFIKMQRVPVLDKYDLKELHEICVKNKALFVKLEILPEQKLEVLEKFGFKPSYNPLCPPTTLVVDLTKSEKSLWNDLSRSAKYSVTRAKREGAKTVVYQNPSQELLIKYFDVEKQTGTRNRFYIQPLNDLLKRAEIFKNDSYLALVYDKNGNIAGGKFYLSYEDTVLYLNGGTSNLARKSKAGFDLMWESILYFKKAGFKKFDLDGVDDTRFPVFTKNWGGFSHFKERFGGYRVKYPVPLIKVYSPIFKLMGKFLPL